MLVPLIITVLVVVTILVIFLRKQHKTKYKSGLISQFYRQPPRYINLNNFVVGRCLGANAVQKIGDKIVVYYKKGMFETAKDENIPPEAVISLAPPATEHEEGLVVVLPYTDNLLANVFPEVRYYRYYIKNLELKLEELKLANQALEDMLREKRSPLHAQEKAHTMLTSIEELLRTVKGVSTSLEEKTLTMPKTTAEIRTFKQPA